MRFSNKSHTHAQMLRKILLLLIYSGNFRIFLTSALIVQSHDDRGSRCPDSKGNLLDGSGVTWKISTFQPQPSCRKKCELRVLTRTNTLKECRAVSINICPQLNWITIGTITSPHPYMILLCWWFLNFVYLALPQVYTFFRWRLQIQHI